MIRTGSWVKCLLSTTEGSAKTSPPQCRLDRLLADPEPSGEVARKTAKLARGPRRRARRVLVDRGGLGQ